MEEVGERARSRIHVCIDERGGGRSSHQEHEVAVAVEICWWYIHTYIYDTYQYNKHIFFRFLFFYVENVGAPVEAHVPPLFLSDFFLIIANTTSVSSIRLHFFGVLVLLLLLSHWR